MPDCQHFEIAIEQRLRGALAEQDARALEAHCATCESCRDYEATARRVELGLHVLASQAREAVDWDRLEAGVRKRLRARSNSLVLGGVIGASAVALSTWGFAPPGQTWAFALKTGALVAGIVLARAVVVMREVRAVARLGRSDELLARYRRMLAKQVQNIRRLRWMALAVVIWSVTNAASADERRHVVVHLGLACIVAGVWLHTLAVVHPRVRRELAELDEEGAR